MLLYVLLMSVKHPSLVVTRLAHGIVLALSSTAYADHHLPTVQVNADAAQSAFSPVIQDAIEQLEKTPGGVAVVAAKGYMVVGLKANQQITKNLSVFFDARNLANHRYAATHDVAQDLQGVSAAQFSPGEERSFYTGVTLTF